MKTTRPIADRLLALADSMQKEIDHGRRPMTQNPTPKRMREYNSRMHDANNAERTQRAFLALAAGHQAGHLPPILADLRAAGGVPAHAEVAEARRLLRRIRG